MGCFWNLHLHCLNNCRYHLFRSRWLQLIPIWQNSERLLQGSELHRPPSSRSWYYSTWFRAAELHNNCICVHCHRWAWPHCPSSPQCKYQLLCVGQTTHKVFLCWLSCLLWLVTQQTFCTADPQSCIWDLQIPISLPANPLKTIQIGENTEVLHL